MFRFFTRRSRTASPAISPEQFRANLGAGANVVAGSAALAARLDAWVQS